MACAVVSGKYASFSAIRMGGAMDGRKTKVGTADAPMSRKIVPCLPRPSVGSGSGKTTVRKGSTA